MRLILEASGIIKHPLPKLVLGDITKDAVIKLTNSLSRIELYDDRIKPIDDNGDIIICPDYGISISNDGKWLSSKISEPNFDTDIGGNVRMSIGVESCYCCAVITDVLRDTTFKKDIERALNGYDFAKMGPLIDRGEYFTNLLES